MDTATLVESQIDYGQTLVEELPRQGFEVMAACWLKTTDDGKWSFYIVSPIVDTDGSLRAYRQLQPYARAMPEPHWIDPLEIRLIGQSHPIARDVLAILDRAPGPRTCPIRWGGIWLGNQSIEGAYIYPPAATVP